MSADAGRSRWPAVRAVRSRIGGLQCRIQDCVDERITHRDPFELAEVPVVTRDRGNSVLAHDRKPSGQPLPSYLQFDGVRHRSMMG